jgi:hypothetical protein
MRGVLAVHAAALTSLLALALAAAAPHATHARGCVMLVMAYTAVMLFLRIKMPNYMR